MVIIESPPSDEFRGHLESWRKYQAACSDKNKHSGIGRYSVTNSVTLQEEEIQPHDSKTPYAPKRRQIPDERQIEQLVKNGVEQHCKGEFDQAVKSFQAALKGQLLLYGGDHPTIAHTHGNIGAVFLRQGQFAMAREALKKSLEMKEILRAKCENDEDRRNIPLADVLNNLGNLAFLQGNLAQSMQLYRQNLRELRGRPIPDKDLASTLHNIGRIHVIRQEWDGASNILAQCQKVEEAIYGPKSIELADTLELIGYVHLSNKCLDNAMMAFSEALSIHQRHFGAVHENVATALVNMAMVMEALGNLHNACQTYKTASCVYKSVGLDETTHPGFQAAKRGHEILVMRLGKKKEAKDTTALKTSAFMPIAHDAYRGERESDGQLGRNSDPPVERRDL